MKFARWRSPNRKTRCLEPSGALKTLSLGRLCLSLDRMGSKNHTINYKALNSIESVLTQADRILKDKHKKEKGRWGATILSSKASHAETVDEVHAVPAPSLSAQASSTTRQLASSKIRHAVSPTIIAVAKRTVPTIPSTTKSSYAPVIADASSTRSFQRALIESHVELIDDLGTSRPGTHGPTRATADRRQPMDLA